MSSSSSSTSADINSNEHNRNWFDLPSDVTTNILERIGVVDILENAQKVCTAWRKICKDPAMWRVIKMHILSSYEEQMCKQAVDRSQGQLVDLIIRSSSTHDELLSYVADKSRQLRRLELVSFYVDVHKLPLMKFPNLEELNFYSCKVSVTKEFIETAVRYCPMLRTFKVNHGLTNIGDLDDEVAIAIGKNLHELRHLELIGSDMSNEQLEVILDGCCHLETLDLRNCVSIDLNGDLGKKCFDRIKTLKLPDDSLEGSPYSDIYEEDLFFLSTDYSELFDVETIMSMFPSMDSFDGMST